MGQKQTTPSCNISFACSPSSSRTFSPLPGERYIWEGTFIITWRTTSNRTRRSDLAADAEAGRHGCRPACEGRCAGSSCTASHTATTALSCRSRVPSTTFKMQELDRATGSQLAPGEELYILPGNVSILLSFTSISIILILIFIFILLFHSFLLIRVFDI